MTLTTEQEQVVTAIKGHILVLAGPGSGKTHTITEKILYLFEQKVIPEPFGLLAITFTNEAANVMRARLRTKGFRQWDKAWIGTFHAFGSYLLTCYGGDVGVREDFELIDPDEQLALIQQITSSMLKSANAANVARVLEGLKRKGIYPDKGDDNLDAQLKKAYSEYQRRLREENYVDFGDMIALAVRLLSESDLVRRLFTTFFRYVVVDEFQDTDRQQLEMVRILAQEAVGSTIVADDDQSIYGFRGAERSNVYRIEKLLNAQRMVLGTNFRSDQVIVEAANAVIGYEADRASRVTRPSSKQRGHLYRREFDNPEAESSQVVEWMLALQGQELVSDWGRVAVITRMRWRADQVVKALQKLSIPWFDRARLKFQDSWETTLGLAVLSLACSCDSSDCFYQVMSAIEDGGLAYRLNSDDALEIARQIRSRLIERKDIEPAATATNTILQVAGLDKIIDEVAWSNTEARRLLKNLQAMTDDLRLEAQSPGSSLATAISQLSGQGAVQIMSGQASKGREFDYVFLAGLEDDVLPSYHARGEDEVAEERRIFYVALTRARRSVYLSWVSERATRSGSLQKKKHSRFIDHIPEGYFSPVPSG